MHFFWFLALCQSLLFAEPSYLSFPSDVSWKSMESPHFFIIYREGQKSFAAKTLKAAERAYGLLRPIFPEAPPSTSIVLADFRDSLNGYSLNFPYPHFVVFASPPDSTNELSSLDQWLDSVVFHEYVHTLHLYPANGAWKWLRSIFGTWVVPNGMMPSHLHEGLATFLETEFSQGGRGRSPFFKMLTRKAFEKNVWGTDFLPLDLLDGSSSDWPHGASAYYFGYSFYEHLWKKKGSKGIYDLASAASSNWPYFVNSPYLEVFGLTVPEIWQEIINEKTKEQQTQKTLIGAEPLSEPSYLTQTKFQKKELALSKLEDRLAFLSSRPEKGAQLEIIDSSNGKPMLELPLRFSEGAGLCWKEEKGHDLFFVGTLHEENSYGTNRFTLLDATEKKTLDLRDKEGPIEHLHAFSCAADFKSFLVFQENGGVGKITLYEAIESSFPPELAIKSQWNPPESSWVSSVSLGNPNLFLLRRNTETVIYQWVPPTPPLPVGTIKGHAYGLRRADNHAYLIASLSGRDEVWLLDLKKKKLLKTIAVSGGINQFAPSKKRFWVSSYEHGGFDLATANPVSQKIESELSRVEVGPLPVNENGGFEEKEYSPLPFLLPRTWIPSALFLPFGFQAGAWIPMFDLSQKHFYDLNMGIDQRNTNEGSKTLPYLSGLYGYRFGNSSSLQSNVYFSPGFLIVSRSFFQRWGASLSYAQKLGGLPIQGKVSALMRKIEPSDLGPANQSIGLGLDLSWGSRSKTGPLDADSTEGIRFSIGHQQFLKGLGSFDDYFSSWASVDAYLESPIWNSALWYLGLKQGYTEGTALYNSYFEGGGELLFSQGRGLFLNRGYLPGSFAARRIFGGNLEFRFPLSRVDRGISLWPVFLQNLSAALVLDTTSFDRGVQSSFRRNWMKEFFWSTGIELKSRWKLFYYLPTQIRLGAYRGLNPGGEDFYFTTGIEASL